MGSRRLLLADAPTRFTVEGRGEFPIAMLGRDRCWPARLPDAAAIGARDGVDRPEALRIRAVTLETASPAAPDRAAWRETGWRVID